MMWNDLMNWCYARAYLIKIVWSVYIHVIVKQDLGRAPNKWDSTKILLNDEFFYKHDK
jgi:hypothetical protein